jgi:putative phage-type endonuclease
VSNRTDHNIQNHMNSPPFNFVTFEQGSREWLEWRHAGIGASDASAVMGESLKDTAAALLRFKRGPAMDRFPGEATAQGLRLEPLARERYSLKTGVTVQPACVQSTQYEWLRASLDGISADGKVVVEIKCGTSLYRKASFSRSVPNQCYAQLQHILAVTGLEMIDFWCCVPNQPGILLHIDRDPEYIEQMITKEFEFWSQMQKD